MEQEKATIGIPFINNNEKVFMDYFYDNWKKFMDDPRLAQSQIALGNRLRPRLVYWSFVADHTEFALTPEECQTAASLAACMELIHKSTILLDDWIDKDEARHGRPSFHIQYSPELMVMYALNILSRALTELNDIFYNAGNGDRYNLCMNTLTETMRRMTQGEILELTLSDNDFYSVEKIKVIIQMETAELLTNSLLIGYYGSGGKNVEIADALKQIGYNCGYIFQCMNDLEPFCQRNGNKAHKGSYNLDYDRERKNIGIAMLYQVANHKERRLIEEKPPYDALIELFNKYQIIEFFLQDLADVKIKTNIQIEHLCNLGISPSWSQSFIKFIDCVVTVCRNRLGAK